jgi:Tfp pilus assembly protein PilX
MDDAMQSRPSRQRGVVLIFSLIVLLILTIGAVALMRSMNNSLFSAGNLAFRRDLTNQGEQAITTVLTEFQAGGAMAVAGANAANVQNLNYSATILPTNAQGVPTALLNATTFSTVGTSAKDITGATPDVTIRYVIDRLCSATGVSSSANCAQSTAGPTGGTGGTGQAPPPLPTATVYRLSVRVSGARGTQVFLQSTFSMPDT